MQATAGEHPDSAPARDAEEIARRWNAAPALAQALRDLMGAAGGEPDSDDPDAVAVWDRAYAALALLDGGAK
jgi:hypothetical protein